MSKPISDKAKILEKERRVSKLNSLHPVLQNIGLNIHKTKQNGILSFLPLQEHTWQIRISTSPHQHFHLVHGQLKHV